jgi:Fe2+ transport system protein FeoA
MGVDGGRGVRKKLFDLGIVPGSELEIVQGVPHSPYVVKVNDTRMMIGWGMVQKVLVYER